jgi:hypothetical protein
VVEEETLWVLVRCRATGSLHRIGTDLAALRTATEAATLSRVRDELIFRSTHPEDLVRRGRETSDVSTWA